MNKKQLRKLNPYRRFLADAKEVLGLVLLILTLLKLLFDLIV